MNFHPLEYAKSHPWAFGIIVVIGGLIFFKVALGSSSSSSSSDGTAAAPTDAEVTANATIQAAQIAASAQAAQYGAQVSIAQIGAGVQENADNLSADVAKTSLGDQTIVYNNYIQALKETTLGAQNVAITQYGDIVAGLPGVAKKDRGTVLSNLSGGSQPTASAIGAGQAGNSLGGIIGSIGGAASAIGSLFSDQNLKENIQYQGEDPKTGLGIYTYNYRGSKRQRRGFIAQDVAAKRPDMVSVDPSTGYLKVAPSLAIRTS